jgi:replicative DNA helicase
MSETAPFPNSDPMSDGQANNLRVPPHSIEAEQAVIGGLLLDNRAWENIADKLVDDDFYRFDHRLLFSAIRDLESRNEPFDAVTLSQCLEKNDRLEQAGGLLYLGRLAKDTPSAANIVAYANIVREKSVLRQLIAVGTDISGSGYVPEGRDSKELLDNAEKKVYQIAEQGARGEGGFQEMKTLLSKTVDKIDHLFNSDGGITGVSTGFDKLLDAHPWVKPPLR